MTNSPAETRLVKSNDESFRLEPVCRFLFRRVAVAPVVAALSLTALLGVAVVPATAQSGGAAIKADDGSYGPIVSIVKPEFSDVIAGETPIVIAVQPRRYPAQSVELLVDGRSVSGVLPIQTSFKWKTTLFADGQHTLTVRVTDTQGFIGQSETRVFINNARKTDDQAPALDWIGVKNGELLSGKVSVRLQATDNFGVKSVYMRLNPAITPDVKPPLASWMTTQPPYEFKIDTAKFADGLYSLDAYAWDDLRNEQAAPRITVGFSNQGVLNPVYQQPATTEPSANPLKEATPQEPKTKEADKTTVQAGSDKSDQQDKSDAKSQETKGQDPNKTRIVETPPQGLPNIPPPRLSFVAPAAPQQGALHSQSTRVADLNTERPGDEKRISVPPLMQRSAAHVAPPAQVTTSTQAASPAQVAPPAQNPTPVNSGNANTNNAAGSPTRVVDSIPSARPALPPAFSMPSTQTVELQPPSLVASPTMQASASTPSAPFATQPKAVSRIAQNNVSKTTATAPAFSVSSARVEASIIAARTTPGGTRIASVLPGELSTTPPAQVIWKNNARQVGGNAQATALKTSPQTNVVNKSGVALAVEKTPSALLPSTPLAVPAPVIGSTVGAAASQIPVAPPALPQGAQQSGNSMSRETGTPLITSSQTSELDRPARSTAPAMSAERVVAAPLDTRPLIARTAPVKVPQKSPSVFSKLEDGVMTGVTLGVPTRVAQASGPRAERSVSTHEVRATMPRVALSPDVKESVRESVRQGAPRGIEADITVSPLRRMENVSFTATRDETLAAIAERFKMPLSVVAAANGLSAGARIAKGTQLWIPQALQVTYKGQAITGDVAPLLIGPTSVAPFRFMFEQQGGTMSWDAQKQQVTAKNDKYEITLTIGSDKALVNSKEEAMDMAAFLLSGRTMIPVRFFESALQAKVEWEPSTGRIYIASTP